MGAPSNCPLRPSTPSWRTARACRAWHGSHTCCRGRCGRRRRRRALDRHDFANHLEQCFLRRSRDTASADDLRGFQLDMVDDGASPVTVDATITGLKFFFDVALDQSELMRKTQPVPMPNVLPVVIGRDEVARLIASAPNLKCRAALSQVHGAGLFASESLRPRPLMRKKRLQKIRTDNRATAPARTSRFPGWPSRDGRARHAICHRRTSASAPRRRTWSWRSESRLRCLSSSR